MSMADRVILMQHGRIEQNGAPVDLYERPENQFVARFIGTPPMNLLALERGSEGAVIAGTEGPPVLPAEFCSGRLGIRPEHIALDFTRGVPATVETVEYLGGDSLLGCTVGGQPIAVRVQGSVALSTGDTARLTWAAGAQHFFAEDGTRHEIGARHDAATLFA
jgi:sn-glycerol 3-phosphate transport system ATP-binding protein